MAAVKQSDLTELVTFTQRLNSFVLEAVLSSNINLAGTAANEVHRRCFVVKWLVLLDHNLLGGVQLVVQIAN